MQNADCFVPNSESAILMVMFRLHMRTKKSRLRAALLMGLFGIVVMGVGATDIKTSHDRAVFGLATGIVFMLILAWVISAIVNRKKRADKYQESIKRYKAKSWQYNLVVVIWGVLLFGGILYQKLSGFDLSRYIDDRTVVLASFGGSGMMLICFSILLVLDAKVRAVKGLLFEWKALD